MKNSTNKTKMLSLVQLLSYSTLFALVDFGSNWKIKDLILGIIE